MPDRERYQGASEEHIREWLCALGVLVAGKMDVEDVQMRLMAYSRLMIDIQPEFLTEGTLRKAGMKFKWFPSFAELHEFINGLRK